MPGRWRFSGAILSFLIGTLSRVVSRLLAQENTGLNL